MRNILILTVFCTASTPFAGAQERLVGKDYTAFYDWFHEQTHIDKLYQDGSLLYTFSENTQVHTNPCEEAAIVYQLPAGYAVTNILYTEDYNIPEDKINGYEDLWYQVSGYTPEGQSFNGYIWGADLAKDWKKADINNDGTPENRHARDIQQNKKIRS